MSNSQTRYRVIIAAAALLVVVLYVGLSAVNGEPGFPLDDGWIHQTYARNLARTGNWAYVPGQVSAGSTSPLWTLLLAVGYWLRLPYLLWTYFLGWICLVWLGWAGMALWQLFWPSRQQYGWLAGVVLAFSWPLVWAAASGMETVLFAALGLQIVVLYGRFLRLERPSENSSGKGTEAQREKTGFRKFALQAGSSRSGQLFVLGVLAGLLVLTRPEGLGLLLLLAAGLVLAGKNGRERLQNPAVFVIAALLPLIPYFAFNLSSSGTIWPNTFYAKQAEYAILWERLLPLRFLQLLYYSLGGPAEGWRGVSGVHLLLLPGLILAGWLAVRHDWQHKKLLYTLPLLWAGGHILAYAWRLPVTYQHGRYLWAALPVWTLFGLAGWQDISVVVQERVKGFQFVWRMATMLTFALLLLAFLMIGAQVYLFDVGVINGEMVAAARWLEANTPSDALIAAHDIGAIGYFAERPLLDLAGLISPEVIDLLADEPSLSDYVAHSSADYLVTAPGWTYPTLTNSDQTTLLFETNYLPTLEQGLNNIAIYRLNHP
ncbi:MAG: hypothetical protein WAM60_19480 [Candidatus Promineifilaceae bacterium]